MIWIGHGDLILNLKLNLNLNSQFQFSIPNSHARSWCSPNPRHIGEIDELEISRIRKSLMLDQRTAAIFMVPSPEEPITDYPLSSQSFNGSAL